MKYSGFEKDEHFDRISFYNGDCMDLLKQTPDKYYDLALVDPPYGINFAKQQTGKGWTVRESKDWDKEIPPPEYWAELFRVSKNQIVWGGNYFTEYLPPKMGWIMWDKGQRDFSLADGELAWTSFDKALRIFEMSRGKALAKNNETGGRFHPTQKPVQLYEWIIANYANPNDKILDTHLGSGSIAIAIDKANTLDKKNLTFVGIELDPDYFRAAVERFKNHKRQCVLSL